MKLYLDDCRMDVLERLSDLYPVDGVTSNPSVLMRCGLNPAKILPEIRAFLGPKKMLMAQVISTNAEDMIREAHRIMELIGADGDNYRVKLPTNPQGIKAIKALAAEGILTDATAIYNVSQGLLAANAGATALAPYITRIDNLEGDGMQVTRDIQTILRANGLKTEIVPGSISSIRQVVECAKSGIEAVAISAKVWDTFCCDKNVDKAVDDFNRDFESLMGAGKTFLDI